MKPIYNDFYRVLNLYEIRYPFASEVLDQMHRDNRLAEMDLTAIIMHRLHEDEKFIPDYQF